MTILLQSADDSASLTLNPSKRRHSRLPHCSKLSIFLHRRSSCLFRNFWSPSNLLTLSYKFFIVKFSLTFSSSLSTFKSKHLINWFWSFTKTFNEFISSFYALVLITWSTYPWISADIFDLLLASISNYKQTKKIILQFSSYNHYTNEYIVPS